MVATPALPAANDHAGVLYHQALSALPLLTCIVEGGCDRSCSSGDGSGSSSSSRAALPAAGVPALDSRQQSVGDRTGAPLRGVGAYAMAHRTHVRGIPAAVVCRRRAQAPPASTRLPAKSFVHQLLTHLSWVYDRPAPPRAGYCHITADRAAQARQGCPRTDCTQHGNCLMACGSRQSAAAAGWGGSGAQMHSCWAYTHCRTYCAAQPSPGGRGLSRATTVPRDMHPTTTGRGREQGLDTDMDMYSTIGQ